MIPDRTADVEALGALLQQVLDCIVATYDQAGISLPARRYLTFGTPAVDCEQLTVAFAQAYSGSPAQDPEALQRCDSLRSSHIVVQLWRADACSSGPRGTAAPTPDALTQNALLMAKDAWLLLDSAGCVDSAGLNTGFIALVDAIQPQGGYVGVQLQLTVPIP